MSAGGADPAGEVGVARLLRRFRERALLTQEQLADRAAVGVRTVRRLEADDVARPRTTTLRLLANALELSASEERALVAAVSVGPDAGSPSSDFGLPAGSVVPRQLPAVPPLFTGRASELADIEDVHDVTAVMISAIDGMAGIGKTGLAIRAAHRLTGRFPDGQLFLDLHGYTDGVSPVDAADALDRLLRALGVPGEWIPQNVDDRAALYRSRLAGQKVLVLLDNAASEAQVVPLLPGTPGCLVLVTSRRRLTGLDRTHTVSLDALTRTDAIALFHRIAGEQRVADESPDAVEKVVELCGRLPLAIRIAAARLRSRPTWTVEHLVEGLANRQHRPAALDATHRGVTAALDLSFRQLGPELQRVYQLLGLHPGADFDRDAAAALSAATPALAERLIDGLLEANLLLELTPGRYRFHDLVRFHAGALAARAEVGSLRREAITRLLDHYCGTASMAMGVAHPSARERRPGIGPVATAAPAMPDGESVNAWLDIEHSNLLAATLHAAVRGWPEHAVHLTVTLHRHLRARGPYFNVEQLYLQVLDAARASRVRVGEAELLVCLGDIRWPLGRLESATESYQRALTLARDLTLSAVEVDALAGLAEIERSHGRYELALGNQVEALQIARRTGDRSGEMAVLISLAWTELDLGRPSTEHLERALTIARAIGDRHEVVRALRGLGHVHRLQGRRAQAADILEQTLVAARAIGSRSGEIGALLGLGLIHRLEGRHDEAAQAYERMLSLAVELGDRNNQFEAYQGLGWLHLSAGRADRAIACHKAALDAVALVPASDQARAHDGLAHAYLALEQREQARQHWQEAVDILARLGVEITEDEVTLTAMRAHLEKLSAST